jgi:hypothetical protein
MSNRLPNRRLNLDTAEIRRAFAAQQRLFKGPTAPLPPEPLFPRWLVRLVIGYIVAHTLTGLALLIAAAITLYRFLPLIHRIADMVASYS